MKKLFLLLCLSFYLQVISQTPNIATRILDNYWKARWLTCPGESPTQYGVYHFRKTFDLAAKPASFVVHVSADNRYRLFVNGTPVCTGPARSDLANWNFETLDIAAHLRVGKNVIAAQVWNAAEHKPFAQISYQTGFILQGNTEAEDLVNTDPTWKVLKNEGLSPVPVDRAKMQTYMVTGDGDRWDSAKYPWGWELTAYNDNAWKNAEALWFVGKPRSMGTDGNWMLVPRQIPLFKEEKIRFAKVRRTETFNLPDNSPSNQPLAVPENFLVGKKPFTVPPNTRVRILFDNATLVNAYPEIQVSSGKNATLRFKYAEALYDKNRQKGNRHEIDGKEIMGIEDIFIPDGGLRRQFRPMWFRTYRYMELDIQTAEQQLFVEDLFAMTYGYPFEEKAVFKSSDPSHQPIWEAGWRTARMCAGENYFDCPYYEQLQYVGDTRIQALISLYVSGDDRLMRKAILDFDHSRIPDGLTQSRYPCADMQVIPTYSLFWISMIYDYWMFRTDESFIRPFFRGMEDVLAWHEERIAQNSMMGNVPWWNFVDWSWEWNEAERLGGVPPGSRSGSSSILTLQFAYTLYQAAELYNHFGKSELATHYHQLAQKLTAATYRHCWDETRGMFADTPDKRQFSQHANILAVLTDALPTDQQPGLLKKIMEDKSITQTTFYFRFYLFEALKKTRLGDAFLPQLDDWRRMLDMGLTTFAENPEPTRSDCHAWSASPVYEFLSTVLGITPAKPGFQSVRIEPFLGNLTYAEGKIPHPAGEISARYEQVDNGWKASLSLPMGIEGILFWKGKTYPVKAGESKELELK